MEGWPLPDRKQRFLQSARYWSAQDILVNAATAAFSQHMRTALPKPADISKLHFGNLENAIFVTFVTFAVHRYKQCGEKGYRICWYFQHKTRRDTAFHANAHSICRFRGKCWDREGKSTRMFQNNPLKPAPRKKKFQVASAQTYVHSWYIIWRSCNCHIPLFSDH